MLCRAQNLKRDRAGSIPFLPTIHCASLGKSLVAQLVKNPPAMQETWFRSLSWEDPLGKGKATHSSILAQRIPWCRKELDTSERLSLTYLLICLDMYTHNYMCRHVHTQLYCIHKVVCRQLCDQVPVSWLNELAVQN